MAQPASTHGPATDAHAPVEHHGSWAPFIIAIGSGFLALAFLFPFTMAPLGLLIFFIGLAMWLREDVKAFRAQPDVKHAHGQPGPLWGMALFIGTEVMIFGSIFAIWFVGKAANAPLGKWGPDVVELPVLATLINTAVLVASGGTLHLGMMRLRKGDLKGYKTMLFITLLLGAAFLVQQVREYIELVSHHGFTIKSDLYGSTFYMLTGTHGAHVAGGLFFLIIVFWRSLKNTQTPKRFLALETSAMYWHFVDVVWLFLVAVVYLRWI